jgi:peptide/nickel transport system permease protein
MWSYVLRRVLYNIPIFLGIILLLMVLLRVNDPVYAQLSKNATQAEIELKRKELGVDRPLLIQFAEFMLPIEWKDEGIEWTGSVLGLNQRSWYREDTVKNIVAPSVMPSMSITVPALVLSTVLSIGVGLISAANRGRMIDRTLVFLAVIGMSVSFLVFIILGQYFGAFWLTKQLGFEVFAVRGYEGKFPQTWNLPMNWAKYCLLPVLISVIVTLGYDTRFYRSVIVEQSTSDYIRTARAKGCPERTVMVKHLLRNAMIPIITRVMITLPFVVVGSLLLEVYFSIPGLGQTLYTHVTNKDFPVTQTIVAVLAIIFIASNILTDVLYALVDPRVRLS